MLLALLCSVINKIQQKWKEKEKIKRDKQKETWAGNEVSDMFSFSLMIEIVENSTYGFKEDLQQWIKFLFRVYCNIYKYLKYYWVLKAFVQEYVGTETIFYKEESKVK